MEGTERMAQSTEKFTLLVDLGTIVVPPGYCHKTHLKTFVEGNQKELSFYNPDITDKNFSNPTRILTPGEKLHVRAFEQTIYHGTTSEERLAFLAEQNAVHTGPQGAALVWDQRRSEMPQDAWYASLDTSDHLWVDDEGFHRVPYMIANLGIGRFQFRLGCFKRLWYVSDAFFCFCEVE